MSWAHWLFLSPENRVAIMNKCSAWLHCIVLMHSITAEYLVNGWIIKVYFAVRHMFVGWHFLSLRLQSLKLLLECFRFILDWWYLFWLEVVVLMSDLLLLWRGFSTQVFTILCFSALCMILQTLALSGTSPTRLVNCDEGLFLTSFVTEMDSISIKSLQIIKSHWFSTAPFRLRERAFVSYKAMPSLYC